MCCFALEPSIRKLVALALEAGWARQHVGIALAMAGSVEIERASNPRTESGRDHLGKLES